MKYVLIFGILFMLGSVIGWFAELLFRHMMSKTKGKSKWINPGFLTGPCLPIYGFGVTILYFLSELGDLMTFTDSYVLRGIITIFIMAVVMTLVELVAGEIFIIKMKIRLWDYRKQKGNYKGIICPLFSGIWAIGGAIYYFLMHPFISWLAEYLASQNYMLFVLGAFCGIFVVDLLYSLQVVSKIKKFAIDNNIVVFYEDLKENIVTSHEQNKEKAAFTFVFQGNLQQYLKEYRDKLKDSAENVKDKIQENTENLKDKIQENTESFKDKIQVNTDSLKDKIQENSDKVKTKRKNKDDK